MLQAAKALNEVPKDEYDANNQEKPRYPKWNIRHIFHYIPDRMKVDMEIIITRRIAGLLFAESIYRIKS